MFEDFIPKEISWLAFNERVLQEAGDPSVPLINRIRFLGIYSSNLDEFFEVRVATLQKLCILGAKAKPLIHNDPAKVLAAVQKKVLDCQERYENIYHELVLELRKKNIFFVNETQLNDNQKEFVREYFRKSVRPRLFPIMIDNRFKLPELKDRGIYLIVMMYKKKHPERKKYSIIEIQTNQLPRFTILPAVKDKQYIIFLDDIIRFCLEEIYATTGYNCFEAYDIKLTRDAELDISDDISTSYLNIINKSLKQRKEGAPVRLGYDSSIPEAMLDLILKKLHFKKNDTIIPGARYHNFCDFMKFPDIIPEQKVEKHPPLPHAAFSPGKSIMNVIQKRDILLNFPYQSYDYFIDLLREASIDPRVKSIHMTLYRVAKISTVVNALINAVRNRKKVVVLLELQARFDEKNNIYWAEKLKEEGAQVIFGISGLKVHSKLCMITRAGAGSQPDKHYCIIGTGNFNEDTARVYTDTYLLTAKEKICLEVKKLFSFFKHNYKVYTFSHLIVSPFNTRSRFIELIDGEIEAVKEGKEGAIDWKLNNFSDLQMIRKLQEAAKAGVKIRLLVRSMFSLSPCENIEARGIVDLFLEHSRLFFFKNGGDFDCLIGSADILPRNLDNRVEVTCPIYSPENKKILRDIFELHWKDNVKSRILDKEFKNEYVKNGEKKLRSQEAVYNYLKDLNVVSN